MAGSGVGGLLLFNLTPEPNSQITTGITAFILLNYSDSLALITELP